MQNEDELSVTEKQRRAILASSSTYRPDNSWELPKNLWIGPTYYEIVLVPNLREFGDSGNRLLGQCDTVLSIIRIDPTTSKSQQFETLWHEVLHAIARLVDIELDEHTVAVLGPYIAQVLLYNPGIRSCIP